MYYCKICNYITEHQSNLKKHFSTKSHLSVETKHNKIKQKKIKTRENNKLNKEIELNTKINIISKDIKIIKNEQKKTNKSVKKITDYMNFLNEYCTNTKPITTLTEYEIENILNLTEHKKYEFEKTIIESLKNKNLHLKIGDLILQKFLKPNNIFKQSVWTSDVSRLIYLIFKTTGENEKSWIRDKKGELFTEMITNPILKKIESIMKKYMKYILNKFDVKNIDNLINVVNLNDAQLIDNFLDTQYLEKIKIDLLKYIAKKLVISVKHNELLEAMY